MHADGCWQAVEGVLSKDVATIHKYLQTWKLKLSTAKRMSQSSTSTTRKLNASSKSILITKPCRLLWARAPRSNVGQDAHVLPIPRVTLPEADITRRTLGAACWIGLEQQLYEQPP